MFSGNRAFTLSNGVAIRLTNNKREEEGGESGIVRCSSKEDINKLNRYSGGIQ